MLTLITVTVALLAGVVLMTEVGQQAMLDQQVSTMESFGVAISDERYAAMEAAMPYAAYTSVGTIAVALPLTLLVVAAILFGTFRALGGRDASFKQVFAIVVFSGAILVLQQLLVAPLSYARESLSSPTNLTVFLPDLEEGTLMARTLGLIDLFYIWWLVLLSIGLSVVYKRRTTPIAWGLFAAYVVVAAGIAATMGALGGS